jgi:hypothetical protein
VAQGSSTRSGTALRCRFLVRVDPGIAKFGGVAGSLLGAVAGNSDRFAVELLLTPERQRVTFGPSADATFTVVHKGPDGFEFWDTATRTHATLDPALVPGVSIPPTKGFRLERRSGEDEVTYEMHGDDAAHGRVRHELTLSTRKEWVPFGPALLRVLHCGPVCHQRSGFPWEEVAGAGLVVRARAFVGEGQAPASEVDLEKAELVDVSASDFVAPRGYRRLDEAFRKGMRTRKPPAEPEHIPPAGTRPPAISRARNAGGGGFEVREVIRDDLTPDCFDSTRFGSLAVTIHQDLLDIAKSAINTVAPLLGSTTITGGKWTVPWLATLGALRPAANSHKPGSGLGCFLREPRRTLAQPPGGSPAGTGLIDRLAFKFFLTDTDANGRTLTQQLAAQGKLGATLDAWNLVANGAAVDANIAVAIGNLKGTLTGPKPGDMSGLSTADQRSLTELYELGDLGVFTVDKLPKDVPATDYGSFTFGPFVSAPLFKVGVTGVVGTIDFSTLVPAPVPTLMIGAAGNIEARTWLPTTTMRATVTRILYPAGAFVLSFFGSLLCALLPFLCPMFATLATLVSFVANEITTITATATGVTWTLDVSFAFDPTTGRLEPTVSVLDRTGIVTVLTTFAVPNLITSPIEALIALLGTLLDGWGGLLATAGAAGIQTALRQGGFQLPVAGAQDDLTAVGGDAFSTPNSVLVLRADVGPIDQVAAEPWVTQVDNSADISQTLLTAHLNLRRDLNPQPGPTPPPLPILAAGTFVGLGLSQNVLNYYVFHQWVNKRFNVDITDPAVIAQFVAAAPGLFIRPPVRVHIWPAAPPRLEVAAHEIALGNRPLVAYFDDVRACFELTSAETAADTGMWELSCNFKTPATVTLDWPWVARVAADKQGLPLTACDPRTWEFVDPNIPGIMGLIGASQLAKLVDLVAAQVLNTIALDPKLGKPPAPIPWTNPLPATEEEILPTVSLPAFLMIPRQQFYLELLARRRVLYALPVFATTLLELFDGSGAPTLNSRLMTTLAPGEPVPVTVGTLDCAQGDALQVFLASLPVGP